MAKVEKIAKNTVQMEIEIEQAKLEEGMKQAYQKLVKKVNIPGFRKGKAPRKMLESYIGKGALLEEAINMVLPQAYYQAVQENQLEPVDEPKIDFEQIEEGKPVVFKAIVDVKPEVTLGEYKGLEVTPKPVNVTEEDIEKYLENLQKRHAKLVTLEEGEVVKGDTVTMDFTGYTDGEPFENGAATDYSLEIGSGQFIPGFEDQIVGMKIGEEKDINVAFPEDYHVESLKAKPALFKVKVSNIKRKELSAIDDEFAKDVSEFATLDELKTDIKKRLEETEERLSNDDLRAQVIDKALANIDVEIPVAMIEARIDTMVDNFGHRLQQQGLDLDNYLKYTNSTIKDVRDQYRAEAEKNVKGDLMLETIAKNENIEVTDEEINSEIEKIAGYYNQTADAVRSAFIKNNTLGELKQSILLNKAVEFLVDNSKKTA